MRLRELDLGILEPPERVFTALAEEPYAAFLDASGGVGWDDDCSYIACRPRSILRSSAGRLEPGNRGSLEELRRFLERIRCSDAGARGFVGGLVGYLGYELGSQIETLPLRRRDDLGAPDLYLCFYDTVYRYDHRRSLWSVSTLSEAGPELKGRELVEMLSGRADRPAGERRREAPPRRPALESNFTRQAYLAAVRRAKRYIREGDIYQVNLSQRFSAPLPTTSWDLYLRLREQNPAPYSCYLSFPELQILGSSPELFLSVRGGEVQTRPIKGTRPRGSTPAEDCQLRTALMESGKDRAELSMIVDLERNDLGRVCEPGSVRVANHARIEEYATVFHTVSTVTGRLAPGKDPVDLIRATFPGGSITGCPKIRAMEIIDELEPTTRGPYTGAMGYLGADGTVELNIGIRTFVVKDGRVSYQVGGGIVADSDPAEEYQETLDKGAAMLRALEMEAGFV